MKIITLLFDVLIKKYLLISLLKEAINHIWVRRFLKKIFYIMDDDLTVKC